MKGGTGEKEVNNTYHSADGNPSVGIDVGQGGLEVLAADVLEVDIDTVRGKAGQGGEGALLLVVEAGVEAELVDDKVQLRVGSDGADHLQPQVLGELADDLAHGAGRRADEHGLAGLGLPDLLQARVGRQPGHAQGAEEHAEVEVGGVLDLPDGGHGVGGDDAVLGDGQEGLDEVALLEVGAARLQDAGEGRVDHRAVELERRRVRRDAGVAHLAPQVRVVRGVQVLDDEAALRRLLV